MSVELQALLGVTAILFVLIVINGAATPLAYGFKFGLGNRDGEVAPNAFLDRSKRTLDNHIEGMLLFAPLVLAIELLNLGDGQTQLGAMIFLIARALFAIIYLVGVPVARSVAWGIGIVGIVMTAIPVIQAAFAA